MSSKIKAYINKYTQDIIDYMQLKYLNYKSCTYENLACMLGILTEDKVCAIECKYTSSTKFSGLTVSTLSTYEFVNKYNCICLEGNGKSVLVTISEDNGNIQYAKYDICKQLHIADIQCYRILEHSYFNYIHQINNLFNYNIPVEILNIELEVKIRLLYGYAFEYDASDIHIDCYKDGIKCKLRISSLVYNLNKVHFTKLEEEHLVQYFLSKGNMSEHSLLEKDYVDVNISMDDYRFTGRTNIHKNVYGYAITIRIIDSMKDTLNIPDLKCSPSVTHYINKISKQTHKLSLITGHMGSGKNTTCYAIVNEWIQKPKHTITIEDPVERRMPNLNQIEVNKSKISFEETLSSVLRQDANYIMIGELNGREVALLSFQSANAGVSVISTLHVSRVSEVLGRLNDIADISVDKILRTINICITQNLVRRLCPHCKREIPTPNFLKEKYGYNGKSYEAVGCDQCLEGYKSALVVAECIELTTELKKQISSISNLYDIENYIQNKLFKEGKSLEFDGLYHLNEGNTSLSELIDNGIIGG